MSQKLAQAIALAADIHENQVDKGGEPYILHPLRVMQDAMRADQNNEISSTPALVGIVAVLHDVIEDNAKYSLEHVKEIIRTQFGNSTLELIWTLTRIDSEDYLKDYIPRIKREGEPMVTIKLADLRDNMTILRQPSLDDRDLLRIQKYHMAYRMLDRRYQ